MNRKHEQSVGDFSYSENAKNKRIIHMAVISDFRERCNLIARLINLPLTLIKLNIFQNVFR